VLKFLSGISCAKITEKHTAEMLLKELLLTKDEDAIENIQKEDII